MHNIFISFRVVALHDLRWQSKSTHVEEVNEIFQAVQMASIFCLHYYSTRFEPLEIIWYIEIELYEIREQIIDFDHLFNYLRKIKSQNLLNLMAVCVSKRHDVKFVCLYKFVLCLTKYIRHFETGLCFEKNNHIRSAKSQA